MELAIFGGEKTKTTPYGGGKKFGERELQELKEALDQNTLFYWKGNKVKEFTKKFAEMYDVPYCVATSSGTAAIHVALCAAGVTAGDEVITSPITDMGTVIGILYQNAIPVFADLDPNSYNMSPEGIEACITDKTKAIVVVHLAGNAADMDPIMEIARKHNIKVIEDCAQSFMCYYKGRLAGTIGDFGCFSVNDFKHISAGDGGMVLAHNEADYQTAFGFADKNYNRFGGNIRKNLTCIAPNYRMNELTGAVALAQLERLPGIFKIRNRHGKRITEGIKDIPGIAPHKVLEGCESSFWLYMFRIDPDVFGCTAKEFSEAVAAEGIKCSGGYLPECVYEYPMFKNKSAFKGTHAPFDSPYYGGNVSYDTGICPIAEEILETSLKLELDEFSTEEDIEDIIKAIKKVADYYLEKKKNG